MNTFVLILYALCGVFVGSIAYVLWKKGFWPGLCGVCAFFLSLFYENRLSCFHPVTFLDRMGVTQIRPLLYVSEWMVRDAARRLALPVVKNTCPADGSTKRQEVKELIADLSKTYPGVKNSVFTAIQRLPLEGWEVENLLRRPPVE